MDKDYFFKDAVEGKESGIVTRGHTMKLYKKRVRLEVGKCSFGNRVVERWNSLPEDVVREETVNGNGESWIDFWEHEGDFISLHASSPFCRWQGLQVNLAAA